ncbi:16S rRNA methyltransferase [Bacillus coahuilensis m2-6]|uniref:16S rRNA (uracil(1498)-N(3))-methyltransferase n=1 Tax=Bacillus coahuilensis TaxID=408580 RepID=UPI0007501EF9|nr:16S rRNA (uracil(1498)-N(3))-methyltransferase [Bacillus coahuilensis]KUP07242.1 16S rRNA methyltransferase [Bacillus coahuilensis m2-6]
MQRYFLQTDSNERVRVKGDDFHHMIRVMRMKEGDSFLSVFQDNKSAICKIEEISNDSLTASVVEWELNSTEMPVRITIVSGLPKGDKLESIIQKGTELGATEFIPFKATRSIVKWDDKKAHKKIERFEKIAKEAAEQSHRRTIPFISEPKTLEQILQTVPSNAVKLVAFEEEAKQGESSQFKEELQKVQKGDHIIMIFGPEGGLTDEEVHELKNHEFISCGLGPRILRTETAPLYALAAISYELELKR